MKGSLWTLGCVLLGVFVCPPRVTAQADMGTIVGTVVDGTGAAVPNGTVIVTELGTDTRTNVKTDAREATWPRPFASEVTSVTVEAHGFKAEKRTGIVLRGARPAARRLQSPDRVRQ